MRGWRQAWYSERLAETSSLMEPWLDLGTIDYYPIRRFSRPRTCKFTPAIISKD